MIDSQTLDVRFFGSTHDRHLMPLDKCFCLSENMPNSKDLLKQSYLNELWEIAMSELDLHINKLERKYDCVFKYAPENTRVDFAKPFQYLNKFKSKFLDCLKLLKELQDLVEQFKYFK